ncbi:MAG: hypothetical protein ACO3GP_04630 [Candidatus Limnocylindrus sp.]
MRTVTFQSVLDGSAARIGLDPTQTIAASTASALTEYINTRIRFAWEAYKWPELSTVERRRFREKYDLAEVYPVGSEIYFENNYWRKVLETEAGVSPDTAFSFTLHDKTKTYAVNAIVLKDKIYYEAKKAVIVNIEVTNTEYWEPYNRALGAEAWQIATDPDDSTYPVWSAATAYKQSAQVLHNGKFYFARSNMVAGVVPGATGSNNFWVRIKVYSDFIRSVNFEQQFTLNNASTPATPIGEVIHVYAQDPRIARYAERVNFWVTDAGIICGSTQFTNLTPDEVYIEFTKRPSLYNTNSGDADFPRVLSEYVKFAAAADALREDGQFDKAVYMDGLAADALQKEIDIIELKQGQTRLQGNRRDLFPSTPMQRASSSAIASVLDRTPRQ